MNQVAYTAYNFDYRIKTEGLLKDIGSHITVQKRLYFRNGAR